MLPGEHRLLRHGQPQATKEISGRGSCRPRKARNSTMIWRVIPDNPACRTKSRPGVGKVKGSSPQEQLSHEHDIRREEMICISELFERSEFLIDTPHKKNLRVCPCAACTCQIIMVLVCTYVRKYHIRTYRSSLSAGYQDTYTYLRMCQGGVRIMCHICS